MDIIELQAKSREITGKKISKVRKEGSIPSVLYGHGIKNANLIVDYALFEKAFKQAGASSLVDFKVDNRQPVKVLIQEVQRDPVSDKYIHVDFRQVKMTEKIRTEVELKYVGESRAVKEEGGILLKNLSQVEIESLPQDLVHEIVVDIASLQTFDDIIRVKDLPLSKGITILEKRGTVVASVQPPRTEEELESLEEKPEEKVEEVETVEKEKAEEEAEEVSDEKKPDKEKLSEKEK